MNSIISPLSLIFLVILIFSAILHEVAHGYVAEKLGDPTARLLGRLTLNPLPHIDIFLSILLPLTLLIATQGAIVFGGAKPVPVDPYNLKDGRKDMALVSLAGPFTNIILSVLGVIIFTLFMSQNYSFIMIISNNFSVSSPIDLFAFIIAQIIKLNLLLAIFNLLPIPPLDGSKIFALILPEKLADSYLSLSSFGTIILLLLLAFPIGGFSLMSFVSTIFNFSLRVLGL